MIYLIIAGVLLLLFGLFFVFCVSDYFDVIATIFAILFFTLSFICLVVVIMSSIEYTASKHKAKIINREFGTNYTQEEVFYAEDVIDTIREIKRNRVEVKIK